MKEACLLVSAHPDDETLAVGALLSNLRSVSIAHVTDGAPRDRRFFPRGLDLSRARYAALRRDEAAAALSLAGVPAERILSLGAVDQEATHDDARLPELQARLSARPPS